MKSCFYRRGKDWSTPLFEWASRVKVESICLWGSFIMRSGLPQVYVIDLLLYLRFVSNFSESLWNIGISSQLLLFQLLQFSFSRRGRRKFNQKSLPIFAIDWVLNPQIQHSAPPTAREPLKITATQIPVLPLWFFSDPIPLRSTIIIHYHYETFLMKR